MLVGTPELSSLEYNHHSAKSNIVLSVNLLQNVLRVYVKGLEELTVADTKITAEGFLGIGNLVTSVSPNTVRIRSCTCSKFIPVLRASSRIRAFHAVPYRKIPSQKATAAECGASKGRTANGVGCKEPTMAACTPPS